MSFAANANLLIEPHLGHNISGSGNSNGIDYKYHGTQYGLRFGGQYLGLMGGLDYNISSYTWVQTPGGDDKFDRTELGLFVGYNLPLMLRFWGAYYFTNSAKDTNASGRTAVGAKYKGNTKELGVGFTMLPFLSLNLAYRNVSIDTKPTGISGGDISNNEIVAGVSLPFTLL
jgi:hypothetical protein